MDGRKLKAKLVIQGLSVEEFVDEVNKTEKILDRNKYYRVLRGEHEFDRKEIMGISEALELTDTEVLDIFFKEQVS